MLLVLMKKGCEVHLRLIFPVGAGSQVCDVKIAQQKSVFWGFYLCQLWSLAVDWLGDKQPINAGKLGMSR